MSPPSPQQCDWQISKKRLSQRGLYLLENGLWTDCRFVVGSEPTQQIFDGHKLFLAMSSPVFEAMFFGCMPEKDPIAILDVQPEAFKALLEYMYTDKINLTSFDQACELCYVAKKYMLPHLVKECTNYLWSDLYPKNACRAYEFAKLFEEPNLMEKCLEIIRNQTQQVLSESSFEDIELSTLMTVFDQEVLNIDSELELFNALLQFASRNNQGTNAKVPRLEGAEFAANPVTESKDRYPTVRDLLKKIRFLTLTPQQFAEGPATSSLLLQAESFAILLHISSSSADVPMPEGFSQSTVHRKKNIKKKFSYWSLFGDNPSGSLPGDMVNNTSPKIYCMRHLLHHTSRMKIENLDCDVTVTSDKNICIYGIQIPAQIITPGSFNMLPTYKELLYAHLLDADGSRLTYTHFTGSVSYGSLIDILFNRPVFIQKNKMYKIGVNLCKAGTYPVGSFDTLAVSNGVMFHFRHDNELDEEGLQSGLIRSLIFSFVQTTNASNKELLPTEGVSFCMN